jgi:hypothetical protein
MKYFVVSNSTGKTHGEGTNKQELKTLRNSLNKEAGWDGNLNKMPFKVSKKN